MRDVVSLRSYYAHLLGVHRAVPALLDLFVRYRIHATWSCVGLVLARNAAHARMFTPRRLPHSINPDRSPYPDLRRSMAHEHAQCLFAPEAVDAIAQTPGQEFATHTFSHYYCDEAGQTTLDFDADLEAAQVIAADRSLAATSLVFPRNQVRAAYVDRLHDHGLRAYRGRGSQWSHQSSLCGLEPAVRFDSPTASSR